MPGHICVFYKRSVAIYTLQKQKGKFDPSQVISLAHYAEQVKLARPPIITMECIP